MELIKKIVEAVSNIFFVLAYFFNPKLRDKKEKERIFNEIKIIESEYKNALSLGDVSLVALYGERLRVLRKKIHYIARD